MNKSSKNFYETLDRKKIKTAERHQRNISQRQINMTDRDEKL